MNLAKLNLCPWSNLGWVDQRHPECIFYSDVYSKDAGLGESSTSILTKFRKLHCLDWLQTDPRTWAFVDMNRAMPKFSNSQLVEELGVLEDFVESVQEVLEKEWGSGGRKPFQRSANCKTDANHKTCVLLAVPAKETEDGKHHPSSSSPSPSTSSSPSPSPSNTK
jgi:hypothetical protein